MICIILNSGTGSRMGSLTFDKPKAFLKLSSGETIISRQIRILKSAGITRFVITTGPYSDYFYELTKIFPDLTFEFIKNERYLETNNIYSIYMLPEFKDDVLFLHGDLVFDKKSVVDFVKSDKTNIVASSNHDGNLEYKDFLGRLKNNLIKEINVNLIGSNLIRINPFFKLENGFYKLWLGEIENQVRRGNLNIYAEVALSSILSRFALTGYDQIEFMEEADNLDDLNRINKSLAFIDGKDQETIETDEIIEAINSFITDFSIKKPFIVHGKHLSLSKWFTKFHKHSDYIMFNEYEANPDLVHILNGLSEFKKNECDGIIAIGGGSCIDVAKAIKLASDSKRGIKNLEDSLYVDLPLMAIPTTAGSGSEATRFSVYYKNGRKESLSNHCLLPDKVVLSSVLLMTQPDYVKKSALLDALSQAIESAWSISATEESVEYSIDATKLITSNYKKYVNKDSSSSKKIMVAANLAGKAINVTATTAPHAFSYGITKNSPLSHGHAVSICFLAISEYSVLNFREKLSDLEKAPLFSKYLLDTGFGSVDKIILFYKQILSDLELSSNLKNLDKNLIIEGINHQRLNNHPIQFGVNSISEIVDFMY